MPATVQDYVELLDAFLCGKLAAKRFERRFLEAWQETPDPLTATTDEAGDEASRALEELFYAVGSYRNDADVQDPRLDLDEDELRDKAKVAIRALQG